MDALNSQDNGNIEDAKESKKRITWVARDHRSMVEFVGGIYSELGHTEYHSNKAIAAVHGLSHDSIKQHLASCQQYRLLEIKFGTGYKITELFKRIYLPINDSERRLAIIESLKSPDTYTQLFKEYEFHVVPPVNGLKNHFVRNFHFKEDIAEKAANIFLFNLEYYELLDSRRVLISGLKPKPSETIQIVEAITQQEAPISNNVNTNAIFPPPIDDGLFELPIPLPNKRKAYLKYPIDSLTKKDIKVITKALEFIASSLDDDDDLL